MLSEWSLGTNPIVRDVSEMLTSSYSDLPNSRLFDQASAVQFVRASTALLLFCSLLVTVKSSYEVTSAARHRIVVAHIGLIYSIPLARVTNKREKLLTLKCNAIKEKTSALRSWTR